jgi:hypothetical protein
MGVGRFARLSLYKICWELDQIEKVEGWKENGKADDFVL